MTPFLRLLALLALGALPLLPQATPARTFSTSLSAVGATQGFLVNAQTHTVQLVVVSPATCAIQLEGSLDNSHWFNLSTSQPCLAASPAMFFLSARLVTYVRLNLTAYSGDAAQAKVQVLYTGVPY